MNRLDPHADYCIYISAHRSDTGEPVEVTIGPAGPPLTYNEYSTAAAPRRKRIMRRLRHHRR